MKYLENLCLENISRELNGYEIGGGLKLFGRIEVYSTKKSGEEKKYSKMLENKLITGTDLPDELGKKRFRKLLIDLIQTLNAAQVYHDFSQLSPDAFIEMTVNSSIQNINSSLAEITIHTPDFIHRMWREINESLSNQLPNCEVYSLVDNSYMNEMEEGVTWSLHYFFCNKELRRICYFSCLAVSKYRIHDSYDNSEQDSADENGEHSNDNSDSEDMDWS